MKQEPNCSSCKFLKKTAGFKKIIFFCEYWGLKTAGILPQRIVYKSIDKECPFYVKKITPEKHESNDEDTNGINIIV